MNKLMIGICMLSFSFQACTFENVEPVKPIVVNDSISYSKTIAPINAAQCNDCHYTNGTAPGDFTTYDGVKEKVDNAPPNSIYERIEVLRDMPLPGSGYQLTDTERNNYVAWIKQGAKNN